MTKKDTYEVLAAQHYIEFQMTIGAIAKKFNLSEKTVHNWKKAGDWEQKRKRYLKSQYSTNQTLYELLHLVSKQAVESYKLEGILPDQKTLYFIMGMTDKLSKLKTYEQSQIQEITGDEETKKDVNPDDILNKIFEKITG